MAETKPNVFTYSDYRRYLLDLFNFKKEMEGPEYDYSRFALLCSYESEAGVRLLLSGHRNVTEPRLASMAETLPLTQPERAYFTDLVHWNQAEDVEDIVFYFDRLSKRLMKCYIQPVYNDHAAILVSQWYHIVIREMVALPGFDPSPTAISKRLRGLVSPKDAQLALDLLVKNGILKVNNGGYLPTDKNIKLERGIAQRMLDILHIQNISVSLKAIHNLEPSDRQFHSLTVSLDSENFKKLKQYLRDCMLTFLTEANRVTSPEEVYQCNLQFFKVTESK